MSELQELMCIYSDVHKETMGFRPRHSTKEWTVEDFNCEIDSLSKIAHANYEQEKKQQQNQVMEFEATIARLIQIGAANRDAAIRWISQAEEAQGSYLEYKLGLPYGYVT